MPKDLLNRDTFGLLPEPEGRWGSFGVSMVTNIIIMSSAGPVHRGDP